MTQQTTKATWATQAISPKCDYLVSIQRLTGDIGGPYGIFNETAWNSHERGKATWIDFFIAGRGDEYRLDILDDGIGLNPYRRERFLNMAQTDTDRTGRNYQDLGVKRMAADFTHCRVLTVSKEEVDQFGPDECPMYVMDFKWDDLFDILAGKSDKKIEATPMKPDWKALGLPKGSTGTRIFLSGVRKDRPRHSADKLLRELPIIIDMKIASKVRINTKPLPSREYVGQPLQLSMSHPMLGNVHINLYIPKVRSSKDVLSVGAFEKVCDWRTFVRDIPEDTVSEKFNLLTDGVYGEIFVEGFNVFVGGSRTRFESPLFYSELMNSFVTFMEDEVIPKLKTLLGVIEQKEKSEREERLLKILRGYGSGLGETVVRDILMVSPSSIELLPIDPRPMTFEVSRFNDKFSIVWDITRCGGKATVSQDGRKVTYYSGKEVGSYVLTCSYKEQPDTHAKVEITIVPRKVLRVNPTRVSIHPGQEFRLRAVNAEVDSSGVENLRWKIPTDDTEGRFMVSIGEKKQPREEGYGDEVVYRAGSKLGTYRIELIDNKQRQKMAFCDITVNNPAPGAGHSRSTGGNQPEMVIEGQKYIITFEHMENHQGMVRAWSTASGLKQIGLNIDHPSILHAQDRRGDDGFIEICLSQIIIQHVAEKAKDDEETLDAKTMISRVAETYRRVVEGYEKSKPE